MSIAGDAVASPAGRKPSRYIVHGSDEMGFTASDEPYPVGCCLAGAKTFPANRIAEVETTSLVVCRTAFDEATALATRPAATPSSQPAIDRAIAGVAYGLPDRANRMFYRVVAVDADGVRSGPSDCVQAPGPLIYTGVPERISLERPTVTQMWALASAGNLRSPAVGAKSYQTEFGLNADRLTWSAHSDTHISMDQDTGLMQIHPSIWDIGWIEAVVICRNQRGESDAYRFMIEVVGQEGAARHNAAD